MFKGFRNVGLIIAVAAFVCVTVIICVCAVSCSGSKIDFNVTYYFVCYRTTDNSVSASSLSGTVSNYGGAGYIIEYENNFYVTVACYYSERDAETICTSLKKRELDCSVLKIEIKDFKIKGYSANKNKNLYLGNLNTLNSLSSLLYECANGLDTGNFSQSKAKDVVAAVKSGLNGLLNSNPGNCFTDNLRKLIAECEDNESGYLLSKDIRYLQVAVIDCIINADLY